jgi:hypothetical protein
MNAGSTEPAALTAHLARMLQWHFDPATGAPFWIGRAARLGFHPLRDIHTLADLRRFPDLSGELRTVPVDQLLPAGYRGRQAQVYESGGTVGAPKRIVELGARAEGVGWVAEMLDRHGFPAHVHWLHAGPTGPHIVGRSMRRLAENRGAICFTVDFDPRWVKRLIASGRRELADEYVEHLLDQIDDIASTQDIRVMFITPAVLEALCARTGLRERVAARLRGLIWSGTSIDAATLQLVEERYFPGTTVVGLYGNSLMGIAPQRPRRPTDRQPYVFQPFWPRSVVEVIDPSTGRPVGYGERGQVLVHLLTPDLFLPNVRERDTAIRVEPGPGDEADGLADVRPVATADQLIVEGVY